MPNGLQGVSEFLQDKKKVGILPTFLALNALQCHEFFLPKYAISFIFPPVPTLFLVFTLPFGQRTAGVLLTNSNIPLIDHRDR